jgi:hypothetical protein
MHLPRVANHTIPTENLSEARLLMVSYAFGGSEAQFLTIWTLAEAGAAIVALLYNCSLITSDGEPRGASRECWCRSQDVPR